MAKTRYKSGEIWDYLNSGSAISSGDVVSIANMMGIAINDIAANATGPVDVAGVHALTKASGAWTIGQSIYYDSGAGDFTTTSTGNAYAGVAFLAATSGATTGYVHLNAGNERQASILDISGNEVILLTATGSAVNEITVANAATGNGPSITASGSDANVDLTIAAKGTGTVLVGQATSTGVQLVADQPILDSAGLELLKFSATGSAVNEITIANAATGNGPSLTASGETNVDITLAGKGTGSVLLGQATSTGVQLVADQPILDSAGLELVKFTATGTAVNEVTIANAATGNGPSITATGETNVDLTLAGKGTGTVQIGVATGSIQLGTVGTDLLGFYGTTPAAQPAHNADPAAMAAITAATLTDNGGGQAADGTIADIASADAAETCDRSVIADAVKELSDQINKLIVDVTAAKTAIDANNAAIDAINADFATLGLTAAA